MKRAISLTALLGVLWWLLSGQAKPLLLAFGLASVLFTVWLTSRMDRVDLESQPIPISRGLALFWAELSREIVLSSIQVVRAALSPRMPIQPHFLWARTRQPTDVGKVTLANSITLTPGTVTVDVQGDVLLVHALTESSGQSVAEGVLDQLLHLDFGEPR